MINILKKRYLRLMMIGAGYIFLTLLLSGCQVRESGHSITFIEDETIEYSSDFRVTDLILAIDEYKSEDFVISEDDSLISLPNGKTVGVNILKKEIRLETIRFDFRYMDRTYTKEVIIQDTTAPSVTCENTYEVEKGNQYFDLKNLIVCTDNYTETSEIEIYFNGEYDVNKKGNYEVQVLAYDQMKNKTEKTIKIKVTEDEPTVIVKPDSSNNGGNTSSKPSGGNNNNSNSNNSNNNNNSSSNSKPSSGNNGNSENTQSKPNSSYKPSSKTFTIDTYDTFDECYSACQKYINECMNKGYRGRATATPIKRDGVYIGYQAIFN